MCGTLLRRNRVRTRKAHRCFGCNRIIPKGSLAFSWFTAAGFDSGGGHDCLDCDEELKREAGRGRDGRLYSEDDGCVYMGALAECDFAQFPILEVVA